jgi:hypothetical protein
VFAQLSVRVNVTIALLTALNIVASLIKPLQFNNVPVPQISPLPLNAIPPDDPFAQPASVPFNGCQYHHLPPELAQALQNLNPFPPGRRQGRGRGHVLIYVLVKYYAQ